MKINDEKKVDILLLALKERYESMHKIRERIQNIGIWIMGILFGASGWLVQSNITLNYSQKTIIVIVILMALIILNLTYIKDLQIGFKSQQRVAAKIENALGFFTPENFDDSKKSIYPDAWKMAGTRKGNGNFFHSMQILLSIGFAFLLVAVLLNGSFKKAPSIPSYNLDCDKKQKDISKSFNNNKIKSKYDH